MLISVIEMISTVFLTIAKLSRKLLSDSFTEIQPRMHMVT